MKIAIDPIPKARIEAEQKINARFAPPQSMAIAFEHFRKRMAAEQVLSGASAPDWFAEAARIEQMSVEELARLVAEKDDEFMRGMNLRRAAIRAVRAARTPAEIEAIVKNTVRDDLLLNFEARHADDK